MPVRRQEALDYHAHGRPGKIQVTSTKPFRNQHDLSLAYTPGVAEPCREIAQRAEDVYAYTARGNLVAVVSNGTGVRRRQPALAARGEARPGEPGRHRDPRGAEGRRKGHDVRSREGIGQVAIISP